MTRLIAAASAVVVLAACTAGGEPETTEEPTAEVAPATTLPTPAPTPTPAPASTSTSTTQAAANGAASCSEMQDQTVSLWQDFFAALGTMDASDLGSEEWLEIDAAHAIPLENHGIETEAAGCGSARLLLCNRLGELEPSGALAEFFLGIVVDECGA